MKEGFTGARAADLCNNMLPGIKRAWAWLARNAPAVHAKHADLQGRAAKGIVTDNVRSGMDCRRMVRGPLTAARTPPRPRARTGDTRR
jgi:hypothetical protein